MHSRITSRRASQMIAGSQWCKRDAMARPDEKTPMRFDTEGAARSSLQPSLCERYRSLINFPTMISTQPDQHLKCMRHKECINPTRKIGTHNFRHNHTISSKKQIIPSAVLLSPYQQSTNPSPERKKPVENKRISHAITRTNALLSGARCALFACGDGPCFSVHHLAGRQVHHQRSERETLGRAAIGVPAGGR
jgi:hypothetical protein